MKIKNLTRKTRNHALTGAILTMVLLLLFSQGAAVYTLSNVHNEKSGKKEEKGKKGDEAVLLLSASATVTSFQIHFEPMTNIGLSIPESGITVRRFIPCFTEYFNNYFQTLFQFIIASKAP